MFLDLKLSGGLVVDGSGNPWFRRDVGIRGDRIVAIGDLRSAPAHREVKAEGLVVCPGFIDMHSHSDVMLFAEPEAKPKVWQGVTTEVLGQDGLGVAPSAPEYPEDWAQYRQYLVGLLGAPSVDYDWNSFADYLTRLEQARPSDNVAVLLSYGALRVAAMGLASREPTPRDMRRMKAIIDEAMVQGAIGLSLGMPYEPCVYATDRELTELYRVVAQRGGFMVIHLWNESDMLEKSLRRAAQVCLDSGAPLHISHLKCAGKANWGRSGAVLELLESFRRLGLEVTFDQYPYVAGSTLLSYILPPWATKGGLSETLARLRLSEERARIKHDIAEGTTEWDMSWDNDAKLAGWDGLVIASVRSERNKPLEGKTLEELGRMRGVDPADAAMDLLLEEEGAVTMVEFLACEEDLKAFMRSDFHTAGTDGIYGGKPHPRLYGSFPRILARYVREEQNFSLAQAIRHMTWMPAQRLGLRDRGLIAENMAADIVVFDPAAIEDKASYSAPIQPPVGVRWVIVNGQVVIEGGEHTGARPGRVLRRHVAPGR